MTSWTRGTSARDPRGHEDRDARDGTGPRGGRRRPGDPGDQVDSGRALVVLGPGGMTTGSVPPPPVDPPESRARSSVEARIASSGRAEVWIDRVSAEDLAAFVRRGRGPAGRRQGAPSRRADLRRQGQHRRGRRPDHRRLPGLRLRCRTRPHRRSQALRRRRGRLRRQDQPRPVRHRPRRDPQPVRRRPQRRRPRPGVGRLEQRVGGGRGPRAGRLRAGDRHGGVGAGAGGLQRRSSGSSRPAASSPPRVSSPPACPSTASRSSPARWAWPSGCWPSWPVPAPTPWRPAPAAGPTPSDGWLLRPRPWHRRPSRWWPGSTPAPWPTSTPATGGATSGQLGRLEAAGCDDGHRRSRALPRGGPSPLPGRVPGRAPCRGGCLDRRPPG